MKLFKQISAGRRLYGQAFKLFGYLPAVGKEIKIDDKWFVVTGVLEDPSPAKSEFEGIKIQDLSNDIYIPLATALKKFELKRMESEPDELVISIKSVTTLRESAASRG